MIEKSAAPRTGVLRRAAGALALLCWSCGGSGSPAPPVLASTGPPPPSPVSEPSPAARETTVAAAGDIACGSATRADCRQFETSDLLLRLGPTVVLPLGDNQYEAGELADFLAFYGPTWGRLKAITRPVPGNHEYVSFNDARGYFDYFNGVGAANGPAGERGLGYYSYDVGSWHMIALNSNCALVRGCQAGSPQEAWLRRDLAQHANPCTLAYWHHPRFSGGRNGNTPEMQPLWQALFEHRAEVVLVGHDHNYQRFAPQAGNALYDPDNGIREFVVGTGGRDHTPFVSFQPNTEVRNAETFGVLRLTLRAASYAWEFVPIAGEAFTDSGSYPCH